MHVWFILTFQDFLQIALHGNLWNVSWQALKLHFGSIRDFELCSLVIEEFRILFFSLYFKLPSETRYVWNCESKKVQVWKFEMCSLVIEEFRIEVDFVLYSLLVGRDLMKSRIKTSLVVLEWEEVWFSLVHKFSTRAQKNLKYCLYSFVSLFFKHYIRDAICKIRISLSAVFSLWRQFQLLSDHNVPSETLLFFTVLLNLTFFKFDFSPLTDWLTRRSRTRSDVGYWVIDWTLVD